MFLTSINLKNIRKHIDTPIYFANKLNYIVGGNGVGKTTILEAIYYLCTTKSCKTVSDAEVVRIGENGFSIQGNFNGLTDANVRLNYSLTENKKMYLLDNKQVNKFSDVVGKFPVVLLSPADHSITQGHPIERRKFVDSTISQASKTYLDLMFDYNRTLKQRSNILNRIRETNEYDPREFKAWDEKLVQSGMEIIKHRRAFISEFTQYVRDSFIRILSGKEKPDISYYFLEGACTDNLEKCFNMLLEQRREDEIRRATNLVGPHRDDFVFEIDGMNLRSYGSQGQHKTFQTALKFAEYFYLNDKTGNMPIFLLDDVFGELDTERAAAISNYLGMIGQAFITLTDFGNFTFLKTGNEDKIIRLTMDSKIVYA